MLANVAMRRMQALGPYPDISSKMLAIDRLVKGFELLVIEWKSLSGWLGRQDSNLRIPVPKTGALPLGDAPAGGPRLAGERRL